MVAAVRVQNAVDGGTFVSPCTAGKKLTVGAPSSLAAGWQLDIVVVWRQVDDVLPDVQVGRARVPTSLVDGTATAVTTASLVHSVGTSALAVSVAGVVSIGGTVISSCNVVWRSALPANFLLSPAQVITFAA